MGAPPLDFGRGALSLIRRARATAIGDPAGRSPAVWKMTRRSSAIVAVVVIVGALRAWPGAPDGPAAGPLPDRLSSRDFWKLSVQLSEADGYFRSENLVSNETAW